MSELWFNFDTKESLNETLSNLENQIKQDEASANNTDNRLMTTKELANVLGVSVDTVQRTAKKVLDPSAVLRRAINGGNSIVFTEEQATLIKQTIQGHHNLQSRQVDNVTTDYEMEVMTRKVLEYHLQKENEYRVRAERAEGIIDNLANSKGTYSVNQTAKALKLGYGDKTLYRKLHEMNLINKDNTPKQSMINAGYMSVYISKNNGFTNHTTYVTNKGLMYLAKRFNTIVDTSVLPDGRLCIE